VIVLDASIVVVYFNASERQHDIVVDWLTETEEELVTTPLVLAELDYVLGRRAGPSALDELWSDLEDGVYEVMWWPNAVTETIDVARSATPSIGLADASLAALAAHLGTRRIATLDETHFRGLASPRNGEPFVLLPTDA
jgi:predicted nucleic acid-binding protein